MLTFDELNREHPGAASPRSAEAADRPGWAPAADESAPVILAAEADRLNAAFAAAAAAGDVDGCVEAILDLEQLLTEWASDLSDDVGYARTVFRQMIVRLGDLAGTVDPKSVALPAVLDLVCEIRSARAGQPRLRHRGRDPRQARCGRHRDPRHPGRRHLAPQLAAGLT